MSRPETPPRNRRRDRPPAGKPIPPLSRPARTREAKPLVAARRFGAVAVVVSQRIDVRAIGHLPVIGQTPTMVRLPGGGVATLFRYGTVVLFGADAGDREWLLASIREAVSGEGDAGAEEVVRVEIGRPGDEGPSGEIVNLHDAGRERLQLLAEALAKSALLSFHERRVAADFDRIEPLAQDLADDGKFSVKPRELLRAVGSMLLAEHRLTGRAEVMDSPELLWDHPALEGLYARLEGEFELRDRALALERKLATLSKTAETLVEAVRYRSSHRVEWYIVLLIVLEILLTLYEYFLR